MAYTYTLTVNNHAANSNYFMMFQNDPTSFAPNAMALAWFSKFSNPNSVITFEWKVEWGFSWGDTGKLGDGVIYRASENAAASPDKNQITLDYNNAYMFSNQHAGPDPTRFYIAETANIPVDSSASVGITMFGSTVYATQARPNTNITASPHPVYYVAYGDYLPGEVIDISTVNKPLLLPYDTGIYSLTTTLNPDNSWSPPVTLAEFNAKFFTARKRNPKALLSEI